MYLLTQRSNHTGYLFYAIALCFLVYKLHLFSLTQHKFNSNYYLYMCVLLFALITMASLCLSFALYLLQFAFLFFPILL